MKDPQKKKPPKEETPFQRFERLAKKVANIPKNAVEEKKRKEREPS